MTEATIAATHDLRRTAVCCLLLATVLCVTGYLLGGKFTAEKTITALLQPLGAVWLLLFGWTLQLLMTRKNRQVVVPLLAWIILTLCSTAPLVDVVNYYLEFTRLRSMSARLFDPATDEPLDVLIVLGGGAQEGPFRAEAGPTGDRLVYAAQLFQQGHARRLITTGSAIPALGNRESRTASEMTMEIWTKLGIPVESISTLPGRNTFEEVQSILKAVGGELDGQRVGLLTSALHLPRALRLAADQGLSDLIPIAANYRFSPVAKSFDRYLPQAYALDRFSACQHELMAWMVSR